MSAIQKILKIIYGDFYKTVIRATFEVLMTFVNAFFFVLYKPKLFWSINYNVSKSNDNLVREQSNNKNLQGIKSCYCGSQ